ncbi:hypothetical protein FRC11_005038, partial [Ceratobasidium sp. 423]
MPGAGTTDPSPRNTARRATADEVRGLRAKCATLANSVRELEESFSTNKQLRSKVAQLETELGDLKDALQGLLEFKTRATKLLQVLVSKHDVDELKNQILWLAVLSKDPNTFLKSVVDGGQDLGSLQLQLRDSRQMKDVCNDALMHLYGAIKELKPELTLYPHGPEMTLDGLEKALGANTPYEDPINIDMFEEFCKFVCNRGAERAPAASDILAQATDATIQERYQVNHVATGDQPNGGEGNGGAAQVSPKKRPLAYYRSRAEAKRKSRARKIGRMVVTYSIMELETFAMDGAQSQDERCFYASSSRLYYFDETRNVYQEDGTLIYDARSTEHEYSTDISFYIEGTPYWFDAGGLWSKDVDGLRYRVHTWESAPDWTSMPIENLPSDIERDIEMISFDFLNEAPSGNLPHTPPGPTQEQTELDTPESIIGIWRKETQEAQKALNRPDKRNRSHCAICNKTFKRLSSLTDHLNLHSGEEREQGSEPNIEENVATSMAELTIKHDTDLITVIEYLVQNGCADVTSQLTKVSHQYKYTGGQSDIHQGQLDNGTVVAVKCLREITNSARGSRKVLKHTAQELYTWTISTHPNILELFGLAVVRGRLAMVAPWMEYPGLRAYITAKPHVDRCDLCWQIAEGLAYMHQSGVAHGDVKGDNVVVSKEGIAKITDFGCASMKRVFRWAAPEVFVDGASSFETDVYAFGMTMLEALTGDVPYKELSDMHIVSAVLIQKKLPDRPYTGVLSKGGKGDRLWGLMGNCWDREPASRPRMGEIAKL